MSNPIGVSVLGATGSIGASALDVIRMHPDRFKVVGLSAWRQADALASLVSEFSPSVVAAAPEVLAGFPSEANGGCAGVGVLQRGSRIECDCIASGRSHSCCGNFWSSWT